MIMKAALYARVSIHDQQTLQLQQKAMRGYAKKRGWRIASQIKECPQFFPRRATSLFAV